MSSVPIIAMTANALKSDQEACRAAGMVDHVAKPIDLDILTATILRHVSTLPAGTISPQPMPGAPSTPDPIINAVADAIDVDAAIKRVGGNLESYDALVEIYRSDAAEALAQLQQHIRHAEFPQARLHAHTLKGLSATVGATAVAKLAGKMEAMLEQMSGETGKPDANLLTQAAITLSEQFSDALGALPQR